MKNEILYDRLFLKKKSKKYFKEKYNLSVDSFKKISTQKGCELNYKKHFVVRVFQLFKAKISNEKIIYKWNNNVKNIHKSKKPFVFSEYCSVDENGKVKHEFAKKFYNDLISIYTSQTKQNLKEELEWLIKDESIDEDDKVCTYCGISEKVLEVLYNDENYTCKTKRKRGAWFELDRKDASVDNNLYKRENMVLCCYFCNNHKSDVISVNDMRKYFGKPMFEFLMNKYKFIIKS